jgi:hypothetical protein
MLPIAFMIVVFGCGDAGAGCEAVRTLPASYASLSACNAAVQIELPRQNDIEYPVVAARCRAAPLQAPIQIASAGR